MGPLHGYRVVEMAGLGPAPFCAMLLSDMGADVVRIDREGGTNPLGLKVDVLNRGRRSVALNLKSPEGVTTCLDLISRADAVIEGFRPGVMERLGLGPDECLAKNPSLVYGRMTGWGQNGPLAQAAGHDINYIALTGVLHTIGTDDSVAPPLNLVGDFGGGALYLAFGVVCGLLEARKSGKGQVVDAAMVDGAAHLMTMMYGLLHHGQWTHQRQDNLLDGGAHFYGVFECADGKWIAIGSIEPQFYQLLLDTLGIDAASEGVSQAKEDWPQMRERLQQAFLREPQSHWCELMEGTDICFAPVLSMSDAPAHPHNEAREVFINAFGITQPGPAPRFSRTQGSIQRPPPAPGEHTAEVLKEWGVN
ncbi:MAG TPA: carnitine dehydratase [Gammaproteobacteria bacterium]|jgi:alpha-methylacyl-CoA racemase|nr:carnitine dehydratase [Acidiferrobacteraceae bacterium]MDP6550994.1 CaiB/BaiF CoA-transferase family protein [Arenicellales bacterium]HCX88595.1 carnitine dehydratase [Gammaproteobacteria bacterium]|tara:strand:+ start:846 stop:1934 length:1089 start_codon:yes stop_codon:yes gene_type:complete